MSTNQIIEAIEKAQYRETPLPEFRVGDSVNVTTVIVEGKKKRNQRYEGLVVKIQGAGVRKTFTVRRVVDGVGVEKSFLVHSPLVFEVKVTKLGKVRRARLTYMRERIGVKATRVKKRIVAAPRVDA